MTEPSDDDITRLLARVREGDSAATDDVLPMLYERLRDRADAAMRHEQRAVTMQPTLLVHEAWLRLQTSPGEHWQSREHFLRLAGRVMRNILVDAARKRRVRQGADRLAGELAVASDSEGTDAVDLIDLNSALERLGERDPELERLVELRYFAGMTLEESARAMGWSTTTTHGRWALARAVLLQILDS